ncbi:hypothetical protein SCHPADRAFT_892063 [Schizopora paradoxa]|uniref:Ubiquitin-like protease family profile domain-containing protein n=1 Tax=Schizopora paradoxa TaxID=27342 RepID=A0A0H2S1B5_9AGAM|nr:hypothetical protein SCHPADRAFT_892063 [Schizopora paradoxa]
MQTRISSPLFLFFLLFLVFVTHETARRTPSHTKSKPISGTGSTRVLQKHPGFDMEREDRVMFATSEFENRLPVAGTRSKRWMKITCMILDPLILELTCSRKREISVIKQTDELRRKLQPGSLISHPRGYLPACRVLPLRIAGDGAAIGAYTACCGFSESPSESGWFSRCVRQNVEQFAVPAPVPVERRTQISQLYFLRVFEIFEPELFSPLVWFILVPTSTSSNHWSARILEKPSKRKKLARIVAIGKRWIHDGVAYNFGDGRSPPSKSTHVLPHVKPTHSSAAYRQYVGNLDNVRHALVAPVKY